MTAQEMWQSYTKAHPEYFGARFEAWCYGSSEPEKLTELTLAKIKTATASLLRCYEIENEAVPTVDTFSVIIDTAGNALCIIRDIAVTTIPFCEVTELHAYKEGENERTLAGWRRDHAKVFSMELADYGEVFNENMSVVCEEFELVYPE